MKKKVFKRKTRDPMAMEHPDLFRNSKKATVPMFSVGCHTCFDFLKMPAVYEKNTNQTVAIKKPKC